MRFRSVRLFQCFFSALLSARAISGEIEAPGFDIPTTGAFNPALRSFDDTLVAFMKRHAIPGGALAIIQDGKLIYARGYGFADREQKTPVLPTSLFRLASVSKPITSAAVMTLVDSRKLDLDAKVVALLGWEPFLKAGTAEDPRIRDITVRHLLQHSGGWDRGKSGDIIFKHFQIAADMGIPSPPDHASLIRWGLGQPLDFAPGSKFAYSNFGYCVLGRVIEKVSGQRYEDYVRKHVLAPMGIDDMRIGEGRQRERKEHEVCYYDPQNTLARNVFSGDGPDLVPLPYGFASPQTMDAHGGWIASAVDLARFAAALDRPGAQPVLSAESAALLYARPVPPLGLNPDQSPADVYYGMGWSVRLLGKTGKINVWHNGAMPGTSTLLVRLASGRSWAVLFNQRFDGKGTDDIDPLLHQAAAKVTVWPTADLFESYRIGAQKR